LATALAPLPLVVVALTLLNLKKAVFEIMGGIDRAEQTASDAAYGMLFLLGALSIYVDPVLLVLAVIAIMTERSRDRG
jgi:hypothetical protein